MISRQTYRMAPALQLDAWRIILTKKSAHLDFMKPNLEKPINSRLVRYSRAGDEFHYRWAARRCLKLIYPNSPLKEVVVEGSKENEKAGEYAIDITEYSSQSDGDAEEVTYFQLKHSTVRAKKPFNASDLKSTIRKFAQRFHAMSRKNKNRRLSIRFRIITNRLINKNLKAGIQAIAEGGLADTRLQHTIEAYTEMQGSQLRAFCAVLSFADSEGDYNE